MEILSFYVKILTLRSYFDKLLGSIVLFYVSFLFSIAVLQCWIIFYQWAGIRLSWVAGSFVYATAQLFILKTYATK